MHARRVKTKSGAQPQGKRSIGQLAQAAGVNIETIRYYQRRGLIPVPPKRQGGQRHYPDSTLRQIAFVRRAQYLGFTLEEIGGLLRLADGRHCGEGRRFAQAKLEELDERVAVLNRMRRQLGSLIRKCEANTGGDDCPVIRELNGGEAGG